jgi:hypothetical protein
MLGHGVKVTILALILGCESRSVPVGDGDSGGCSSSVLVVPTSSIVVTVPKGAPSPAEISIPVSNVGGEDALLAGYTLSGAGNATSVRIANAGAVIEAATTADLAAVISFEGELDLQGALTLHFVPAANALSNCPGGTSESVTVSVRSTRRQGRVDSAIAQPETLLARFRSGEVVAVDEQGMFDVPEGADPGAVTVAPEGADVPTIGGGAAAGTDDDDELVVDASNAACLLATLSSEMLLYSDPEAGLPCSQLESIGCLDGLEAVVASQLVEGGLEDSEDLLAATTDASACVSDWLARNVYEANLVSGASASPSGKRSGLTLTTSVDGDGKVSVSIRNEFFRSVTVVRWADEGDPTQLDSTWVHAAKTEFPEIIDYQDWKRYIEEPNTPGEETIGPYTPTASVEYISVFGPTFSTMDYPDDDLPFSDDAWMASLGYSAWDLVLTRVLEHLAGDVVADLIDRSECRKYVSETITEFVVAQLNDGDFSFSDLIRTALWDVGLDQDFYVSCFSGTELEDWMTADNLAVWFARTAAVTLTAGELGTNFVNTLLSLSYANQEERWEITYTETCDDEDGDGYDPESCGGPDCNDADHDISPAAAEACDLEDDNCDGFADDWDCWSTVTRYRDTETDAHCWSASGACAGYAREMDAFVVAATAVRGASELVQCSRETDHILVYQGDSDYQDLEDLYDCSLSIGFVFPSEPSLDASDTHFRRICPLYRFALDAGGQHLFSVGSENLDGWSCEKRVGYVLTDAACFSGSPDGC